MKYFTIIFTPLLVFSLVFFSACKDPEDLKADSKIEVNLDGDKILSLINAYRGAGANCGSDAKEAVPALAWSNELAKAALDHSNDMEQNGYFSHESQDGTKFLARAKAAGFEGSPLGENIANGYRSEEAVMAGWMDSPGHCTNIMSSRATLIGIAKSDNGFYWTMVLGKE